jgi:hypothetical protein
MGRRGDTSRGRGGMGAGVGERRQPGVIMVKGKGGGRTYRRPWPSQYFIIGIVKPGSLSAKSVQSLALSLKIPISPP